MSDYESGDDNKSSMEDEEQQPTEEQQHEEEEVEVKPYSVAAPAFVQGRPRTPHPWSFDEYEKAAQQVAIAPPGINDAILVKRNKQEDVFVSKGDTFDFWGWTWEVISGANLLPAVTPERESDRPCLGSMYRNNLVLAHVVYPVKAPGEKDIYMTFVWTTDGRMWPACDGDNMWFANESAKERDMGPLSFKGDRVKCQAFRFREAKKHENLQRGSMGTTPIIPWVAYVKMTLNEDRKDAVKQDKLMGVTKKARIAAVGETVLKPGRPKKQRTPEELAAKAEAEASKRPIGRPGEFSKPKRKTPSPITAYETPEMEFMDVRFRWWLSNELPVECANYSTKGADKKKSDYIVQWEKIASESIRSLMKETPTADLKSAATATAAKLAAQHKLSAVHDRRVSFEVKQLNFKRRKLGNPELPAAEASSEGRINVLYTDWMASYVMFNASAHKRLMEYKQELMDKGE